MAGIILPSSILNNTGIYTKAREIILKYFEIIGITELGSNTFMATGTNTVVLFLRRRNNYASINLKKAVEKFFTDHRDVTLNGVEKPVSKYVVQVWEGISFNDYVTLLKEEPNTAIEQHELYKEYRKKLKAKNEADFWKEMLEREAEKLFYFILTYPQKVVLVKSGQKDDEKRFLGYEFSNRRGREGIHPIQRGKSIAECTKLFDEESFENPEKASTYIYKAFKGDYEKETHPSLQQNISRHALVDMLTFDRVEFEKNISLAVKKKVKFESVWNTEKIVPLTDIAEIKKGTSITQGKTKEGKIPVVAGGKGPAYFHNEANRNGNIITISASGAYSGFVNYFNVPIFASDCNTIKSKDEKTISTKLIFYFLKAIQNEVYKLQRGQAQPHVYAEDLAIIKIPLPPLDIQKKIVAEIEALEKKEDRAKEEIEQGKFKIQELISSSFKKHKHELLGSYCNSVEYGTSSKSQKEGKVPVIRMGNIQGGKIDWNDLVYTNDESEIKKYLLKKNDVLFNRTNSPELVGKVGIYKGEFPAIFAGYLIRINYKKEFLNPVFLINVLNSKTIRDYGFSIMSKSVNQANINGTQLKTYRIPVPSLPEQQKIVAEIEKIERKIATLEKELADLPEQKATILKIYL